MKTLLLSFGILTSGVFANNWTWHLSVTNNSDNAIQVTDNAGYISDQALAQLVALNVCWDRSNGLNQNNMVAAHQTATFSTGANLSINPLSSCSPYNGSFKAYDDLAIANQYISLVAHNGTPIIHVNHFNDSASNYLWTYDTKSPTNLQHTDVYVNFIYNGTTITATGSVVK